ncbi:MAG: transglycosylase SLT domain-containing protein, partial [Halioglobus sp.]|nr:transglycosylase SLT domain-containing protein [Halioglobus sp.]
MRNILLVLSSIALLAGCQSLPELTPPLHADEGLATSEHDQTTTPPTPRSKLLTTKPPSDLWQRVQSELTWQVIDNSTIARERQRYLRQADYLRVVSNRANYYLYHIVEQVEARGFPMELALLPLVESTLNPFATSAADAAGLWQIMPATGEHLGLHQDWWYDGRRDLRDSTDAALNYLGELNARFDGDWLLTLAAYNSGASRVLRARDRNAGRGDNTDFWSLRLPRETRHYVPRLIALAQIISEPEKYGVRIPAVANAPTFAVVDTGGQLALERACELAGVDLSTLRAYNPGHLRWATAPDRPQELLLPVAKAPQFSQAVAALTPADRISWQHYTIVRGDTLIRIARRFNVEVALLREVNKIRGSRIRAGATLMIPQGNERYARLASAYAKSHKPQDYRVRQGDSLYVIAS